MNLRPWNKSPKPMIISARLFLVSDLENMMMPAPMLIKTGA